MDSVAPPLAVLLRLRQGLLLGVSLRSILRDLTSEPERDEFHQLLRRWWLILESGQELPEGFWKGQSIYRQALIDLLEEGLRGASILDMLQDLEVEIRNAMESELDLFVAALPLRALLPLVLFVFPALMIMVFGPLLMKLMEAFK